MSRLIHSAAGLVRAFQVSGVNVFAFVEGGLDRPFLDRLLARKCEERNLKHQVIGIKEVLNTGGKPALITLFNQLRKKRKLSESAWGKKLIHLFVADKDCDDLLRKLLRSKHFLYTPTYDLEAWLFRDGDVVQAVSDACGITRQQGQKLIPNQRSWCRSIEDAWEEWVVLCMISQQHRVNCGCGYSVGASPINENLTASADSANHLQRCSAMSNAMGKTHAELQLLREKMKRHIASSRTKKGLFNYFKGKWISSGMEKWLLVQGLPPDSQAAAAGAKVLSTLVSQVGVNAHCPFWLKLSPEIEVLLQDSP